MPTDFDRIIDRCGTASAKWAKYAGRDVIPLWVADTDFAAPGFVCLNFGCPRALLSEALARMAHAVDGA